MPAREYLCNGCRSSTKPIVPPICTVCGRPLSGPQDTSRTCGQCIEDPPPFDSARSIFYYQEPVKALIHRVKYHDEGYSLKALSFLAREHMPPDLVEPDLIIPIPLHLRRLRERGFNQSIRLAEGIFPSIPVARNSLIKVLDTKPQTGLSGKERLKNVKDAFTVIRPIPEGVERVLLLDDVYTTGATVKACAKVLKQAGVKEVHILTVARAIKAKGLL
ncbi:MAG: ComF family protein [Nitrospiraceae bacterium]|nr:ComF family protein [Nitrospiraceae bacterium]